MTGPTLTTLVTGFFVRYLAAERNVSPHTTAAYRDTLKLLLQFTRDLARRPIEALQFEDLAPDVIARFLDHLETVRHNSIRTRNARLAAIHSFMRYVLSREPSLAVACQRVLAIPVKKTTRPLLGYLTEAELAHVLTQIDRSTDEGERDYLLVALLYDTGARIQELLDVMPSDCRLTSPAYIQIRGKGRRERLCPLLPQTARLVAEFLRRTGQRPDDQRPLVCNRRGERLTRHGARYLLLKYVRQASCFMPTLQRKGISPHTVRHTKGMHLLQSGVPLVSIKDFLGHVDLKSTEVYVQIDLTMKRDALNLVGSPTRPPKGSHSPPADLLHWLESL
jgi:site-specific recombinase XerD